MPHHTGCNAFTNLFPDCQSCEHLLIPHDMLLVRGFNLTVHFALRFYICNAVLNEKQQSLRRAHRCNYAVSRCIDIQICLVFWCCVDNLAVEVSKDFLFTVGINVLVGILIDERCNLSSGRVFFTEAVKWGFLSGCCAIECTLNWHNTAHCVILHIVGEKHQLRDIHKSTELLIGETLSVHAGTFRNHTTMVIGLLDLNEHKR